MELPEYVAKSFHEEHEKQAPEFGYKTREASAVPWADVPEQNKKLMISVAYSLLIRGVITVPMGFFDQADGIPE
jgi:hypothetical protein